MKTEGFKTFTAIMIALVTIASALVAWRAAVASSEASQADFSGLAAAINAEQEQVLNDITVSVHYQAFLAYTRYNELGYKLQDAIDAAGGGDTVASLKQLKSDVWGIAYGLQSIFFPSRYLRPDGTYDSQREIQEKTAESERKQDTKPDLHFSRADDLRLKADLLVVTLILLGISFWMFTCAQILRRTMKYAFAVGGMFFLAASVMGASLIEIFM